MVYLKVILQIIHLFHVERINGLIMRIAWFIEYCRRELWEAFRRAIHEIVDDGLTKPVPLRFPSVLGWVCDSFRNDLRFTIPVQKNQ